MQALRRDYLSTNVHVRESRDLNCYMLLKVATEVMHFVGPRYADFSKFIQILVSLPTNIHTTSSGCLSTTAGECVPELLIGQQDHNISD